MQKRCDALLLITNFAGVIFYTTSKQTFFPPMRKELLLAASAFVVSVAGSSVAHAQCVLKGTVIDAATNEPLVGVTVALQGTPNKVSRTTTVSSSSNRPKRSAACSFSSMRFQKHHPRFEPRRRV